MKRNGYTSAGKPRYRCTSCGASSTNKPNPAVARGHELNRLLAWLESKETQSDRAKMTTKTDRTWRRKLDRLVPGDARDAAWEIGSELMGDRFLVPDDLERIALR